MKIIMLALHDYRNHMTDEGWQLQEGLRLAGVTLCGKGYDGRLNCPEILDSCQPDLVIIADPRDWTAAMPGAFDKGAEFTGIEALRDVPTAVVFKDAASCPDFQRGFHDRVSADALICYYHPMSVCAAAPWVDADSIIRTYHTIDAGAIPEFNRDRQGNAIVSGARGAYVYPVREVVFRHADEWGIHVLAHPGYGNRGCAVRDYYRLLNHYRVSIATASRYGFALRKIIEGVACGCAVLTDLARYDRLPCIEGALVVMDSFGADKYLEPALRLWSPAIAEQWAHIAKTRYHYATECQRLFAEIERRFNA